jgi:hypothetical protein
MPEQRTFTFFPGYYGGDDDPELLYGQNEPEQITEAELKEYYNSDNGLVLREQFGSYDNYLAYMTEREQLIQDGQYDIGNWGSIVEASYVQNHPEIDPADVYGLSRNDFIAKYGLDPSEVQVLTRDTNIQRVRGYSEWIESEQIKALNEKYGISGVYVGKNGDVHSFNGSTYVKSFDAPQTPGWQKALNAAIQIGVNVAFGNAFGAVLGPVLSSAGITGAAATAASSAISSMAIQAVTTGDIDLEQALISAAVAYIGDGGVQELFGDGAVTDALSEVQQTIDTFKDAISTGNDIADAAILAFGQDSLTQLVATGTVNPEQALGAALGAGISEVLAQDLIEQGIAQRENAEEENAEFEDFLSEQDTLDAATGGDPFAVSHGDGFYSSEGVLYDAGGNPVVDTLGRPYQVDLSDPTPINQDSVDAFYAQGAADYLDQQGGAGTTSGTIDVSAPDTGQVALDAEISEAYNGMSRDQFTEWMADKGLTVDDLPANIASDYNEVYVDYDVGPPEGYNPFTDPDSPLYNQDVIINPETGQIEDTNTQGFNPNDPNTYIESQDIGDSYLAYHTGSDVEGTYYLIRGNDGRDYITDGVNVELYAGGFDPADTLGMEQFRLDEINDLSLLDRHILLGGRLPGADARIVPFEITGNEGAISAIATEAANFDPTRPDNSVSPDDIINADFDIVDTVLDTDFDNVDPDFEDIEIDPDLLEIIPEVIESQVAFDDQASGGSSAYQGNPSYSTNTNTQQTGSTTTTTTTTPSDPNVGDPNVGDPNVGDPTTGDPTTGDPTTGDPTTGDPNVALDQEVTDVINKNLPRCAESSA